MPAGFDWPDLTPRERLENKKLVVGGDGVLQALAVVDEIAAEEDVDVLTKGTLVVYNVTGQAGMASIEGSHDVGYGLAFDFFDFLKVRKEALQVTGEFDAHHVLSSGTSFLRRSEVPSCV
jgi:hypothetical protein